MTAVVARRTPEGVRFVVCDVIAKLEARRLARAAQPSPKGTERQWPLADVYRVIGAVTIAELSDRTGISRQAITTWHAVGTVPERSADKLAIALDQHPSTIWGPSWWG